MKKTARRRFSFRHPATQSDSRADSEPPLALNDDQLYSDRQIAKLYGIHRITYAKWRGLGLVSPGALFGPNTRRTPGRDIRRDLARKLGDKT